MTKQRIIDNPDQWIITRLGDFVRIKDSEIFVEKKLEAIREHLKKPYKGVVRFQNKTPEQISKERYDKVLEEVNFDYDKFHDWIYDEKNKDRVEIIKLSELTKKDYGEAVSKGRLKIITATKNPKWRFRNLDKDKEYMVNEETGQVFYYPPKPTIPHEKDLRLKNLSEEEAEKARIKIGTAGAAFELIKQSKKGIKGIIPLPKETKPKEKHTSTIIFLHGTYGAINTFPQIEKNFPNTKFIYPNSPTLQYDMWHGSGAKPGSQEKGWINITGDAHELMDTDVLPNNPPPKKNFEEADKIIHLDYPQLRRATNYVNEIIEAEIANGIPPEKIFVAGYSQGGLLTLVTALTSPHKIGGFISLCGLLPRWDKLLVRPSDKNKETPILLINNSQDPWVPFWTGKKSYDLLKERGYNVEFETHPGLEHDWKNEDIVKFVEKCLNQETKKPTSKTDSEWSTTQKIITAGGIIGAVIITCYLIILIRKKRKRPINNA